MDVYVYTISAEFTDGRKTTKKRRPDVNKIEEVKMKKLLLVLLGLNLSLGISLQAQDLHFSQFYNSPLLTNPCEYRFHS